MSLAVVSFSIPSDSDVVFHLTGDNDMTMHSDMIQAVLESLSILGISKDMLTIPRTWPGPGLLAAVRVTVNDETKMLIKLAYDREYF